MRANKRFLRGILSVSVTIALAGCASSPVDERQQTGTAVSPISDIVGSNLDLARMEYSRGNYGNAIALLRKELSQKPASVAALNGLGACYDQLGRYDVAQRYYFKALDLAPESSLTLSNIGYSYLRQGKNREAVAILELALQKDGANQVAVNNLDLARKGLTASATPVQIARSTNNGSRAEEIDFLSLLSLPRQPDTSDTIVTASVVGTEGDNIPSLSAVSDAGLSTLVRMPEQQALPEHSVQIDATELLETESLADDVQYIVEQSGISEADTSEADSSQENMAAEESPGQAFEEVQQVAILSAAESPEPQAVTEESVFPEPDEELIAENQTTLMPANEDQTASVALLSGQAVLVTPVIESDVRADQSPMAVAPAEQELPPLTLTIVDTPEPDLARISDVAPSLPPLPRPLNLVVENGNGVRGIARATSSWLEDEQLDIKRIGDADNFDYATTVIYHRPEFTAYAQEIAASLNLNCDIQATTELATGADVRVILGHDFASRVSIDNGWLSFGSSVSDAYLSATLRLEVANGNGVNGMAARVREYLKSRGGNVIRVTDAENFEFDASLLYYRPGTRIAAEGLAASLPVPDVRLIETNNLRPETDARLVIGQDFVPLDNLVLN